MVKNSGLYPSVVAESGDVPAVGLAGARLLTETSRVTGLGNELSQALSTWRRSWAVHDPGKIMADLAVCVALPGRCLSDLSLLRRDKEVFGPVASDPTVSRLIGALADHVEAVEAAVNWAPAPYTRGPTCSPIPMPGVSRPCSLMIATLRSRPLGRLPAPHPRRTPQRPPDSNHLNQTTSPTYHALKHEEPVMWTRNDLKNF